jgi:uncharacterized tellurite resistance protein B-like protein
MTDEDRKAIIAVLQLISASLGAQEEERESIKEIVKASSEKFGIDKKKLRKMAKTFHKNSFNEEVTSMVEFQELYETVVVGDS